MAELLVRNVDNHHPDPRTDERATYKRGDIVFVAQDGHEWGRMEGPPRFRVVKMPGVAVEDAQYLRVKSIETMQHLVPGALRHNAKNTLLMVQANRDDREGLRRRRYRVDLDALVLAGDGTMTAPADWAPQDKERSNAV